jgi:hypothetical protein
VRALGLILLVAACGPSGLTIEVVVDDPAIVKVELYAGASCGSECPRITAPPGLAPMSVDQAFVVDDPRPFVVEQKDFADGVAGFRLEAPQDTTLAILVAVGYDAQNQIKWSWSRQYVDIPDGDAAHWRIELAPTSAIGLLPQPEGTERAVQWQNPSGGPACLLLEHWGANFVAERELLGPAADRDCDGVSAATECAPWIPNALGAAPTIDNANCVTPTTIDGAFVCTLGGPECTENPALPHEACVPVEPNYCTPSSLCQCKGTAEPATCLRELITNSTGASDGMPHVKCVIHVDATGAQCDSQPLEIDLGAAVSASSTKCKGMAFNDPNADTAINFNFGWHIGEGKLYIESFTEPCKASVRWEGGTAPLINIGLVDAELDNGYHLLVPVRAEMRPGCDNVGSSSCQFIDSRTTYETMYACVGVTPMMSACAPDSDALCSTGPTCNGMCCGEGEICGANGCSCGGGAPCTGGDWCENGAPPGDYTCGQTCCGVTKACPL